MEKKTTAAGNAAPGGTQIETRLDALRAMRTLLAPQKRWTQGAIARNEDGQALDEGWHAEATCWCLGGAAEHVLGSEPKDTGPSADDVFERLDAELEGEERAREGQTYRFHVYNDDGETTHEDVLALIDRSIESEEAGHKATA